MCTLQYALEAGRLLPGMVLSWALAIQIYTAHFLLFLAELVHPGFALLVAHNQQPSQDIHLDSITYANESHGDVAIFTRHESDVHPRTLSFV